ncbi:hypothetical protein DPMN_164888 [Dreissena polymorpha]|uniref:Uncharacterized protein n=1 Tax=Dreissena polymorpha TaxID=45954 RepID=A0A9D4EW23_DREPO|nr:hypothetical protein DPMN_164888 [Dreissena polymorpha]
MDELLSAEHNRPDRRRISVPSSLILIKGIMTVFNGFLDSVSDFLVGDVVFVGYAQESSNLHGWWMNFSKSRVRVHDSQGYKNVYTTRVRNSLTFELSCMCLYFQIVISVLSAAVVV